MSRATLGGSVLVSAMQPISASPVAVGAVIGSQLRSSPRGGANRQVVAAVIIAVLSASVFGCGGSSGGGSSSLVSEANTLQAQGTLAKLDTSSSVAGPDENANGIRDDIDAFIASQHTTTVQTAALTQMAKAYQTALLSDPSQVSAVAAAATAINNAVGCIWSTFGATGASPMVRQLEAYTANTLPRIAAYDKFNEALNGQSATLATGAVCE